MNRHLPVRRSRTGKVAWLAGLALIAAGTLSGCAMADGLLESTGQAAYTTQAATLDILSSAGISVQLAPVCAENSSGPVTCTAGKTTTGATINVSGPDPKTDKTDQFSVSVGDNVIFHGSAIEVMRKAGRVDK